MGDVRVECGGVRAWCARRMNAAQHLREHTVEIAESALEAGLAFRILLLRRRGLRMPHRMRHRRLLREQQEEDAG